MIKEAVHTAEAASAKSLRLSLTQQIQDHLCLTRQAEETGTTKAKNKAKPLHRQVRLHGT
jgi:hypothetical protein